MKFDAHITSSIAPVSSTGMARAGRRWQVAQGLQRAIGAQQNLHAGKAVGASGRSWRR